VRRRGVRPGAAGLGVPISGANGYKETVPLGLRVPLALIILLAALVAVFAPAPSARARALWLRPALAGVAAAVVWSGVALEAGRDGPMRWCLCAGSLLLALAVWLQRGDDPPRPPDDEDEDAPPPSPGPEVDWDRWEREFDGQAVG
jgi:hypothetical protein